LELYLSFGFWHLEFRKHEGQMLTKRIERTLTIETARNTRLTYEKELLNSKKNSHFYKTNHPGSPSTVAHTTPVKWDVLKR